MITANLLNMLSNNGPSRKSSRSGGDIITSLPTLPRQNSLPMPTLRLRSQSSSLGSGPDSMNTINSPGSPKAIYGLLSDEESMYRQKQGPLSPLSDTQYRSGGDSNGDSGISTTIASGVVYPIPASPRGTSSKQSIPLPTAAAAFERKGLHAQFQQS